MLVNPSFTGMVEFATTGDKSEPGAALLSSGYIPQEILPAEQFNWLMNRASKGVTESESYIDNINKELNALLVNLATTPNSGTTQISDKTVSAATINTIMKRDSAGRAKVVAPSASDDIAVLSTVTTHAALTVAGTHGSAVAATINTLVHRDSAGRAQIVSPSADADIANKGWTRDYCVPVGTVYFQGPNDATPSTLWPGTTWSNVSSEEAGLFRRSEGGLAVGFGSSQSYANASHSHGGATGGMSAANPHNHGYVKGGNISSPGGYARDSPAADGTNYTNTTDIAHTHSISSDGTTEARPSNITVRKWRRTS